MPSALLCATLRNSIFAPSGFTAPCCGRSSSYESKIIVARENAINEMKKRAEALGADAVVGVDIDYEVLGANNGMVMVTASGTAVVTE